MNLLSRTVSVILLLGFANNPHYAFASDPDIAAKTDPTPSPHLTAAELAALRPAARPGDVSSPRALLTALHNSVSGRFGSIDWSRLRSLFLPGARIGEAGSETSDKPLIMFVSADQEIRLIESQPPGTVNKEFLLKAHIEQYGSIASAFYAHTETATVDGKTRSESLVNTAEMMFDGKRWWIACALFNSSPKLENVPHELKR